MKRESTVLVFGANGQLGTHVVEQALAAGYRIRAFVRSPEKYKAPANADIEIVQGDATNYDDVVQATAGAEIVVSCLGNPPKKLIMMDAYNNIMQAAAAQSKAPRCIMISSIGMGKSSWFVRFLLMRIGGKKGFLHFEQAEKIVLDTTDAPFVVVRASGLTNKQGKGTYKVIDKPSVFFPSFISRADVATFFVDCLSDQSYDGKAVMIEGA